MTCGNIVNGRRCDDGGGGGGGGGSLVLTTYDLDFSAQPNQTIVTGANTIDGNPWTGQVAAGESLAIVNGSGLVWVPAATSTVWSNTTQTASNLYMGLSTLYSLLATDMRSILEVEVYFSTLTLAGVAAAAVALYAPSSNPPASGNRMAKVERAISSAVQVFRIAANSTSGGNYQIGGDVVNAIGLRSIAPSTAIGFGGQYAAGFPTTYPTYCQNIPCNLTSSERDPRARMGLGFPTNSAGSAASSVVVARLRARAWTQGS